VFTLSLALWRAAYRREPNYTLLRTQRMHLSSSVHTLRCN
jgi:hypothetical protein